MNPDGLPSVGDAIAGKYRLTRELGRGGMGAVYEALHLRLGQKVAIKVVLPEVAARPELAYRFENEARAAARLHGPHTARVFDVDVTPDGLPYIVMELLEGHSLRDELRLRGPLPVDEAVRFVRQACEGVDEAHRAGVVHRDLKPANLFLSVEGGRRLVKVVDFGIAKASDFVDHGYHTATGAPLGTYRYMSPEQAQSPRSVDARTDVWSLGVVLYQLLTGKTPFNGEGAAGIVYAIATQAPPPLRAARRDVPEALAAVVERALTKAREDRYQTVRELSDALAPFEGAPAALPTHSPEGPRGPLASHPPEGPRGPLASRPPESPRRPLATRPPEGAFATPPEGLAAHELPVFLESPVGPRALGRGHASSDEAHHESVTSGAKSHVVPIGPTPPAESRFALPLWAVVSVTTLLFGGSVVAGVVATRLRSDESALTPAALSNGALTASRTVQTPVQLTAPPASSASPTPAPPSEGVATTPEGAPGARRIGDPAARASESSEQAERPAPKLPPDLSGEPTARAGTKSKRAKPPRGPSATEPAAAAPASPPPAPTPAAPADLPIFRE
ncbi:MAG TPA: protein kinase [Polyangiaceae bacterium]|nr:protein kinase [Polyangiaceae bacterium]